MTDPREILNQAQRLRTDAREAREAADLIAMGGRNRLYLTIGSKQISDRLRPAIVMTLSNRAAMWLAEAEALEATVIVVQDPQTVS